MVVSGKYGEGKTHLLNMVFNMAWEQNMVVSRISLSKETPFYKPHLIYSKIVQNTYLPGRFQPGFEDRFVKCIAINSVAVLVVFTRTVFCQDRLVIERLLKIGRLYI